MADLPRCGHVFRNKVRAVRKPPYSCAPSKPRIRIAVQATRIGLGRAPICKPVQAGLDYWSVSCGMRSWPARAETRGLPAMRGSVARPTGVALLCRDARRAAERGPRLFGEEPPGWALTRLFRLSLIGRRTIGEEASSLERTSAKVPGRSHPMPPPHVRSLGRPAIPRKSLGLDNGLPTAQDLSIALALGHRTPTD